MGFMEIILSDDVPNLGNSGQIVRVRAGYGRNYLIPRGYAVLANKKNRAQLEHQQKVITARRSKMIKTAEDLKAKLEEITLTIQKKVGENEKLFGSVTPKEIVDALDRQGLRVDRKNIHLDEPLKTLGVHTINVKLDSEVHAALKVWVVSE